MIEGNRAVAQPVQGGPLSRRSFLAGSAAALAGGALLAVPGMAKAHTTPEPPTDVDVLNYALTLEHLEYAFYRDGLETFGERELENADVFDGLGRYLRNRAYRNFRRIRNHEDAHVETLVSVIKSLGGKPVPEATYNFEKTAFTSVAKFVSVAQFLENTGVTAYDGAIAHIEAAKLLTAGATIATVEARHASYLNLLNRDVSFPGAFDEPEAPVRLGPLPQDARRRRPRRRPRKGRLPGPFGGAGPPRRLGTGGAPGDRQPGDEQQHRERRASPHPPPPENRGAWDLSTHPTTVASPGFPTSENPLRPKFAG